VGLTSSGEGLFRTFLDMALVFTEITAYMDTMVLIWSQFAGGYVATSTFGVYMAYHSELDLLHWFSVFKRQFIGRFADRHRIDFGAFDTLKSAQQACENHAREFRPEDDRAAA
jgi:hypothetical protein